MKAEILPSSAHGTVRAPLSKSWLHRALICAALADEASFIDLGGADPAQLSQDVCATVDCLTALGAAIVFENGGISVSPVARHHQTTAQMDCRESGSTLRFFLPVIGALGRNAILTAQGRLPQRPLSPLREQLADHGMTLSPQFPLQLCGQLQSGEFTLRGDVSSQFITGLLFALPILSGDSVLHITGKCESAPYITLTCSILEQFGVCVTPTQDGYFIKGNQRYRAARLTAEGDWSGAAFPLAAAALGRQPVRVTGLRPDSVQGDRAIIDVLARFGASVTAHADGFTVCGGQLHGIELDAADIPDLVPAISAVASAAQGTTIIRGAARLRLKESDRLLAIQTSLGALGADLTATRDGLIIHGKPQLDGGTADSFNDHRIAMSAAITAVACKQPVTVLRAQCVAKSYPHFFEHLQTLGTTVTLTETEEA